MHMNLNGTIEKRAKLSKTFSNAYPKNVFEVINRDNYETFIGGKNN